MNKLRNEKKAARAVSEVVSTLTGAFLSSLALFSFINPNGFVGGGVGGIATILEVAGVMKSYVVLLLLNIPLLVAAIVFLKKGFAVKTVAVTLLTSGIMALMDKYNFFVFTGDRLLSAIYSGLLYGLATGILFEADGSTGGTEIIARLIMKKRPAANISMLIFLMDVVIIIAGLAVFDIWSVAYAIVCSFCFERILSFYLGKGRLRGAYYVITDKPEEVSFLLHSEFGAECNNLQAKGGYTGNEKTLVKAYLPAGSVNKFKAIMKVADPAAFSYTAAAIETDNGKHYEK